MRTNIIEFVEFLKFIKTPILYLRRRDPRMLSRGYKEIDSTFIPWIILMVCDLNQRALL